MPRPQIGARTRIGGLGQRLVNSLAIYECGAMINRRADERMAEREGRPYHHQLVGFGGAGGVDTKAEVLPGTPEQGGIAGRVGGRRQQQDLRGSRQRPDLAEESGLQAPAQRKRFWQRDLTSQLPA